MGSNYSLCQLIAKITETQRLISASMSACIRSLYSSDQWAPGLPLVVAWGRGAGTVLLSLGDFRAPIFNFSVARGDVGLEDEFELFMQLLVTYSGLLRWSCRD